MTSRYITEFDGSSGDRGVPLLSPLEVRVLGVLLEKQQSVPESYPMTVNAVVVASNQKTNRDPVMDTGEPEVLSALRRLNEAGLAREVSGSRAMRWEHLFDYRFPMTREARALLTMLLLRGAQTVGELRARSERLRPVESALRAEEELIELGERSQPLVIELPRRAGQKETRWMHLFSGPPDDDDAMAGDAPLPPERRSIGSSPGSLLDDRLSRLESTIATAEAQLAAIRAALGL